MFHMISRFCAFVFCAFLFQPQKAVSQTCLTLDQTLLERQAVVSGNVFRTLTEISPIMCMKECLSMPVCRSVNIYPDILKCEVLLHNSTEALNGVAFSSDGMTIDAVDIPKEFGGGCRNHSCLQGEKCLENNLGGYKCAEIQFCSGSPPPYIYDFTIDRSKGVSVATYLCPEGFGYNAGDRHSYCDPIADTWSIPNLICAYGIPGGCGIPPPLSIPHNLDWRYEGNLFNSIYTCPSVTDPEPMEYCPHTLCTGVEEWTSGANLSCSAKDCYNTTAYEGKITCTKSGRTCQRWDQQTPHIHNYYTDRSDFHNYCRISFDLLIPWCFTTDIYIRWEFCPVYRC